MHNFNFAEGNILLVNKPTTWTSFDVVNKIRFALGRKNKVGHAGTLDPLASGLLLICTGKKTKQIEQFMGLDKSYQGSLILGATTASFDAETPILSTHPIENISEQQIINLATKSIGIQQQTVPIYSAVKLNGKALYKTAHKGGEIEVLPTREVNILEFNITNIQLPVVTFTVTCSKGTYIRSLVNDFGANLGCGAYLSALKRTKIGEYSLENAWELPNLITAIKESKLNEPNIITS